MKRITLSPRGRLASRLDICIILFMWFMIFTIDVLSFNNKLVFPLILVIVLLLVFQLKGNFMDIAKAESTNDLTNMVIFGSNLSSESSQSQHATTPSETMQHVI